MPAYSEKVTGWFGPFHFITSVILPCSVMWKRCTFKGFAPCGCKVNCELFEIARNSESTGFSHVQLAVRIHHGIIREIERVFSRGAWTAASFKMIVPP